MLATFSDWLYTATRKTHQIALDRLFELVYRGMVECLAVPQAEASSAVAQDFALSASKEAPAFLKAEKSDKDGARKAKQVSQTSRQARHLAE